jgi:hypothetical protein
MECEPAPWYVTQHTAFPLEMLTATAPHPGIVLPPSVKASLPPSGVGVTLAAYATRRPASDGLAEDARSVLVEARFTR